MNRLILMISIFLVLNISSFAQVKPLARSSAFADRRSQNSGTKISTAVSSDNTVENFLQMARAYIKEEKFTEAKEALRTAIRISPMNMEAWSLYDDAVTGEYLALRRDGKLNPTIERDIDPTFSITRVDSYVELDTLYLVGSIKNLSKKFVQKVQLTAKIIDGNKRELRKATGSLKLSKRGLQPNESSLFEIPFKRPPKDGKTYQVKVSSYE